MVGLSSISFTFLKISVAKLITLLSLYMGFTPQAFPPQAIDLWSMFLMYSGDLPDQKTLIIAKVIHDLDNTNKMGIIIKILVVIDYSCTCTVPVTMTTMLNCENWTIVNTTVNRLKIGHFKRFFGIFFGIRHQIKI